MNERKRKGIEMEGEQEGGRGRTDRAIQEKQSNNEWREDLHLTS